MARKDKVADGLATLASLKTANDARQIGPALATLISDSPSFVVSRAAELAADRAMRDLIPALVERLLKLVQSTKSDDNGCAAAHAIVKALIALEAGYEAEPAALLAIHHQRWESVYGGSVDVAVAVRGHAAILLAAMGSREALRAATELLAETDQSPPRERASWSARCDAARALGMIGSDGAAAVLRFKLLTGDAQAAVLGDCLSGLLAIEKELAFPLLRQMLSQPDTAGAEAAILALGGWRDRRAFDLLKEHDRRLLHTDARELYLASIAMTRQPPAIDYLLALTQSDDRSLRTSALTALEPLRVLPQVAERLKQTRPNDNAT